MNPIRRLFRSLSNEVSDAGFESYYGMLVRNQAEGGPSADEARRDYAVVRDSISRVAFF